MNPLGMWFTIPELAGKLGAIAASARAAMKANAGSVDVGELAAAAAAAAEALERFAALVGPSYDEVGQVGTTTSEEAHQVFDDFMFDGVPLEFREFLAPHHGTRSWDE